MEGWGYLGGALLALGAVTGTPGLLLVGLLVVLAAAVRGLWARRGLKHVLYERRFGTERAVWGDEIPLDLVVWNRKILPLAWLQVEDYVNEEVVVHEGVPTRGAGSVSSGEGLVVKSERPGRGMLVGTWTLAWYERVVRHFHIVADHRGIYSFEAIRLRVADLFGRDSASEERPYRQSWVVRPRTVPVHSAGPERAPIGSRRAQHSLFHDPALYAGVRPYQAGDPLRHVHWKATAHVGRPVTKRFDPSREREVLLALDMQTVEGPHWQLTADEELAEQLCVTAASIARRALADGSACGLATAAFTATRNPVAYVPPSAGPSQLARIADTLARVSPIASAPFEHLLASLARRIPPGATLVTMSVRDPAPFLPALRRLARSGYRVRHLALGPDAPQWVRRARAAGIDAAEAELRPDWRTADALVVAG